MILWRISPGDPGEDGIRHSDFPDIVHQTGNTQNSQVIFRQAQTRSQLKRVAHQPLGMTFRAGVLGVQTAGQRKDDAFRLVVDIRFQVKDRLMQAFCQIGGAENCWKARRYPVKA